MQNDSIVITAKLNVDASEGLILKDLEKIQGDLAKKPLRINCAISDTDLKNIQTQLSNITRGLNVDVGTTGVDAVQQSMQQTASAVNNANQQVQQLSNSLADLKSKYSKPIEAVLDNQGLVKASETMQRLKEQLADLGTVSVQGIYGDNNGVNKLEKMIATIKSAQGELRTLSFELGDNDLFRFISGKFDNEGIRKQTEEISKFVDTYTTKLNSLKAKVGENFAPNISATLGEDINKATVTFDSFEQKLAELGKGNGSIEELRAEFVALDGAVKNLGSLLRGGDSSLNQFTNATINARNFDKELKSLEVDYEKLSATSKELTFDSMANAQQKLLDLQKTQSSEGYTEKWIRQYQEVSVAVKQVAEDIKLAKKLEQQDTSSDVQKQLSALKEIADAYKKIREYSKTTISATATDEEKSTAQNYLNQYEQIVKTTIERLAEEKLLTAELAQQIQAYDNIRIESDNVANARAEGVEAVRRQVEEERKLAQQTRQYNKDLSDSKKIIEGSIKALQSFNNGTAATRNSSNANVIAQTATNADIISRLQGFSESLSSDSSVGNVQRIKQALDNLIPSIEKATKDSAALNQELRSEGAIGKANYQLENLKNQILSFANSNSKAINSLKQMRDGTTFLEKWQSIIQRVNSGNLDANGIQKLTQDFRLFKTEAQAAGLSVNKFFTDMQSQLRLVVQRWISFYAIANRITSSLSELKELDKILTEIAKSSDVTRESLQELGNAAFDMANQYGRLASDYLYGVQEFSRAGFRGEQLTGLTQVSLLAQAAGDIETDLANSYVIATNAAYNFKGSQEALGNVLDRQNYVTNNYALNMTDLAEATKIAASQAAQSGVEIDEMTAALATMISTTQQGGTIAARSLRGILMNIQQVKGEVGDGEDDITAESLSKYEAAAKSLGVSLKEVKDGVTVLRNPMEVLNDLATAFNKEADDSIKKANLINAIGGKIFASAYRNICLERI